jgi:4-amino-4-deoxy-L-arabinose transferase-like glycosyltransferase
MKALNTNDLKSGTVVTAAVTLICLAPFLGKAFHIDDPLFIWSGKQIVSEPADFYGFDVNWYGREMPMSEVMKNPPTASYYIGFVGKFIGWSEIALHTAFLIPALFCSLGTYYLAKHFCEAPLIAALAGVLTPVFLVSGSNVMCDTMMLAFWVWAVFFWVRGIKSDNRLDLLISAFMIAICALTKYFGMSLLVLLLVYSIFEKRRLGIWLLFLLIPTVILAGYQWATFALYGRGLLLDAAAYASQKNLIKHAKFFSKGLTALAFTGGCVATVIFYSTLIWSRRVLLAGLAAVIVLIVALSFTQKIGEFTINNADGVQWGFVAQFAVMAVGGAAVLSLASLDFFKHRNADTLLLLLWVLGTFVFAAFVNWAVNARSILPMVPAVGILLARRIEKVAAKTQKKIWKMSWPLVPAMFVAMMVTSADYALANSAKNAANSFDSKYKASTSNIWFEGHWGFQYYMQEYGFNPLDYKDMKCVQGDIIIIPSNNTNIQKLSDKKVRPVDIFSFTPLRRLSTMHPSVGAGFYADVWGPLPFAIGKVQEEKYYVFKVK